MASNPPEGDAGPPAAACLAMERPVELGVKGDGWDWLDQQQSGLG